MNSARSQTPTKRLVISFGAVILVMATPSIALSQTTQDLFNKVEILTLDDGMPAGGVVSLSGHTAVVGGDGVVHVFERESADDHWSQSATLVSSDAASGFGKSVATDGRTTVVGADGTAYVFQRAPGNQSWQEVGRLTGNTNATSFGTSVAVNESTLVVGAPAPDPPLEGPGVAYVFERADVGSNAWDEVARLMGPPNSVAGMIDVFGHSVAIDRDTVVVGAFSPRFAPDGYFSSTSAFVFTRDQGGPHAWGMVATLPLGFGMDTFPAEVSISGDTAIVGSIRPPVARIFERHHGGPNLWGEVARLLPAEIGPPFPPIGTFGSKVGISGNMAVVNTTGPVIVTFVFARNEGGGDTWNQVARLTPSGSAVSLQGSAISDDTIFANTGVSRIEVYVADSDRDGIRDGADSCPRDPLNNITGGCQRASGAYAVLDDLIALEDVVTETRGKKFYIVATFTNTSDTSIRNPFFDVTELTGSNELVNADAGAGGVGATLSPDIGDGILSAGESVTVTFIIRLATHDPFSFRVSVRGETGT